MLTLLYIGIFAASLLLSFVLTRYMRALCLGCGWVVPPFSDRHMHARPLPRLGGVAVFLSFLLSVGAASVIARWRPVIGVDLSFESLWRILVPACLIFALGVYDDLR